MLFNNLRSAWRSLTHNKSYSIINITGLCTGIAACLLIGLYVNNELSFDNQVPDRANVYRLNEYMHYPGGTPQLSGIIGPPIAPLLKADHPEIITYTRVLSATPTIYQDITLEYGDKKIKPNSLAPGSVEVSEERFTARSRHTQSRNEHLITLEGNLSQWTICVLHFSVLCISNIYTKIVFILLWLYL